MCAYRLHADYDRTGRLSGDAAEWAGRKREPGAVVRANLDADARRLPASVARSGPSTPDRERQAKTAGDDEPIRMQVQEVSHEPGPLFVVLQGADPQRIAVVDSTGVRIRPVPRRNLARYPLPAGPYPKRLALEAVDLAASPATNRMLVPGAGPPTGARIVVRLERDGAGGTMVEDEAVVTLAPFVLIGNAGRLERLYMCAVREDDPAGSLDDNGPAVADVRAALAPLGVPLVLIPQEVHGGDSWIQDQYQLGYTRTPDGVQRVLLHTPRTRSDASRTGAPNLGGVLAGHFLSKDIGVCQAFWDRELTVPGAGGAPARMGFAESDRLLTVLTKVLVLRRHMVEMVSRIGTAEDLARMREAIGPARADVWKSRSELDLLLSLLRGTARAALTRPDTPWKKDLIDPLLDDARRQVAAVTAEMPIAGDRARLRLPASGPRPAREFVLSAGELVELDRQLGNWHSGHNYGGNIEVGPPSKNGPAGVVVVGNTTQRAGDGSTLTDMDPDLLAFLRGQAHGHQSVVEVDTSWLDVGHVDEMLAFVPDPRDPRGLGTVLRAAPAMALLIITEAKREFLSGLNARDLAEYTNWRYISSRSRHTIQGTKPITHLLRGLRWLQHHEPGQTLPTEPPEIYQHLARQNASGPTAHDIPLPVSPWSTQPAPVYPAGISVYEMYYFSDNLNEDLEAEPAPARSGPDGTEIPAAGRLTEAVERITTEYDGRMPIVGLPVFFDRRSPASGRSTAFTPNLANLQVAGDRLLIPRPHGPRMSPESAARVLRAVAARFPEAVRAARLTPQWLRARGLNRTTFWARHRSVGKPTATDLANLAFAFADGFPRGMPDAQIRRHIQRANANAFDAAGRLNGGGWRQLVIPENKVDLFEAWTEAVADKLGYRVQWVEAWYYHVRLGSIHCGTNVLRAVPADRPWWR
ncbi:protein-arginine deiminase family protein [Nonomuraea sp. NPDC059023]|uniref:protein-arginine deiminase family protein n=1 Tax=unclassified Nonomuraea TaxID=2593643 RepID=UPI003685E26E